MAFTVTGATANEPRVPGARRRWAGLLTVDNSYVSGTGFVVPAAKFGMTTVDFASITVDTTMVDLPTFISGGANLTFKVLVIATTTQLASSAGSGIIFPIEVLGV